MSRLGGYTLIAVGIGFSFIGTVGMVLAVPLFFIGAMVVVKRSLDI